MQLTTREIVSIRLARDTAIDPGKLADIVKRIHASAGIIRHYSAESGMRERAAARAAMILSGTGWQFDGTNIAEPAIVKGGERIVLH